MTTTLNPYKPPVLKPVKKVRAQVFDERRMGSVVHMLRNPNGWTDKAMEQAYSDAADIIEQLQEPTE